MMWMWSQGASTTIHIFLSIKEFAPVVQNFMEKVFLKRKFKACHVTSVNYRFTFPRKIFLLFKLHVSILFQIKSISHYWLKKERFFFFFCWITKKILGVKVLDWMICSEGLDITSKLVGDIYTKVVTISLVRPR